MATADEIRNKALKRMGVLSTNQTVSSEISADLDAAYAEVYAQLFALDITTWEIDEEVPDELIHPIVALTAYNRIDEYSIPNDRYQRIVRDAIGVTGDSLNPGAIASIKTMQASNVYKTATADYF